MFTTLLTLLCATAAIVLVRAESAGYRGLVYVSKPLATLTLIALAAFSIPEVEAPYQRLITIGLALSLVGDVFLMWPRDRFVYGLVAFLAAHLLYIAAFVLRSQPVELAPFLPFVLASVFIVRLLWRHAGALRFPVAGYALVIAIMTGCALSVAVQEGSPGAWLAAAGSVMFVLSDAALAMDRFVGSIPSGRTVVLATYYPAQWLIALSVSIA